MTATLELIGAPTDVGASVRGAGMGPDALRVAGLAETLTRQGFSVVDRGNLAGPATPWAAPTNGLRHLDEVIAWNRAVYNAVDTALGAGRVPLMLGGDHCLAIGSISAIAWHVRKRGQKLRVLWLDAHTDVNTDTTSPSGNIHGMPVSCLLGHGPAALTGWSGERAALVPEAVRFIGIRSVDDDEKEAIRTMGLRVFDMRHIDEHGMRHTMTEALQDVDEDTHLHVSFDLDCLDPADAPGVGTGVRGGPTYREMQLCMEMAADTGRLGSLDVVELNPALDVRNQTAEVAVALIESLFGKSTLTR
ncbi:arginase [Variovorax sp. PAMC28562]|uniref:arginase n=1 Tax=unclassified Variovorax TaxID=663243 RepID=UPI00164DE7D2|nr:MULTISPECIES: arginase [unclassified Variovorax]MBC7394252.1 arginase [Variovorax sp.]MEB0110746.1 arginase [Variovorax sp. RTB1]QNK75020.1 arginase [Variovorax sp. PAMC28562]